MSIFSDLIFKYIKIQKNWQRKVSNGKVSRKVGFRNSPQNVDDSSEYKINIASLFQIF